MKKTLFSLILLFLTISNLEAHTSHYKGIKVINMEVFRNENPIGYSNYFFTHGKNSLEVKNYTQFKVKLFNVVIFSVSTSDKPPLMKGSFNFSSSSSKTFISRSNSK